MTDHQNEKINLNSLTVKELLIRLYDRVDGVMVKQKDLEDKQSNDQRLNDERYNDLRIMYTKLDTIAEIKGKNAGIIWGGLISLIISLLGTFLRMIII
jgi:muramoyltetrapeptide carboxypeptidase LdcA involved in peptidoglycan recycling